MSLAKDLCKLFGGMFLVILGFAVFGFIIYVFKFGITIPWVLQ